MPGCASCALTTTGQPAASADAVSPPATENASGKLLAPNTATGPSGTARWRMSGRGNGRSVGLGGVDAGAVPAALAQHRGEQPQLSGGAADLAGDAALGQAGLGHGAGDSASEMASMLAAIGLEEARALLGGRGAVRGERLGGGRARGLDVGGVAVAVGGSSAAPAAGSKPRISAPVPATSAPAMIICPVSCVDSAIVAVTRPTLGLQPIHVQDQFGTD